MYSLFLCRLDTTLHRPIFFLMAIVHNLVFTFFGYYDIICQVIMWYILCSWVRPATKEITTWPLPCQVTKSTDRAELRVIPTSLTPLHKTCEPCLRLALYLYPIELTARDQVMCVCNGEMGHPIVQVMVFCVLNTVQTLLEPVLTYSR